MTLIDSSSLDRELPRLEITPHVWSLACDLAIRAREAGLTIPASDLLILACARHHRASLEHCDEHFSLAAQLP